MKRRLGKKEFQNLNHLQNCEYICQLHDFFFDQGEQCSYIVMKFYEEGDLYHRIRKSQEKNSLTGNGVQEDEVQILKWMLELSEGVAAMHKLTIIHRDLKPQNIFLENGHLRIGDFGVSSDQKLTSTFVGTAGYVAPEMMYGGYTQQTDMYSVGCILLDLLTLRTTCDVLEMKIQDRIHAIPKTYSEKWTTIAQSLLTEPTTRWTASQLKENLLQLQIALASGPVVIPAGNKVKPSTTRRYPLFEMKSWSTADVIDWLEDIELVDYTSSFKTNLIDGAMLTTLNEEDFKELGLTNRFHLKKLIIQRTAQEQRLQEKKRESEKKVEEEEVKKREERNQKIEEIAKHGEEMKKMEEETMKKGDKRKEFQELAKCKLIEEIKEKKDEKRQIDEVKKKQSENETDQNTDFKVIIDNIFKEYIDLIFQSAGATN